MKLALARDADLTALNTFGVQARAPALAVLEHEAQLPALAELCAREGAPLVLGGGSNVLFARDPRRTVLRVALRGMRFEPDRAGQVRAEAAAGEPWDAFVRAGVERGLWGLENLALVWGLVGASPIQNIGAYGVEMRERFESLRAFDLSAGTVRTFDAADCRFGYRDSVFKTPAGRGWLVLSVRFRLGRAAAPRLDYGELRDELARRGAPADDPRAVADAVSAIRRRRLPDPARLGNAGSFFKNPVLGADAADALRARAPDVPLHAAGPDAPAGARKASAAWLIERAGWKGVRRGDAGVSDRHALVLVNHGTASGAQLLALAAEVQQSVLERFGVRLEPEPVVV